MKIEKCESCGSSMVFNSETGCLECKKCGANKEIDRSKNIKKHHIDLLTEVIDNVDDQVASMHCDSCGAIFTKSINTMSNICEYCGSSLVMDFKSNMALKPDACIPFAFNLKQAREKFLKIFRSRAFMPNDLKKDFEKFTIESQYIPTYNFGAETTNDYDGRLSRRETDSDGDSRTVRFNIKGNKNITIKNATLECSSKFNQNEFNEIKPFDMTKILNFDEKFIMGYQVENSDRKFNDIRLMAKQVIDKKIRNTILSNYDYDTVEYLNIKTTYNTVDYSYLILPTYQITYKYKNKIYKNNMNGQTGKVGGKYPLSVFKVMGLVLGLIGGIGMGVFIILKLMGRI